MRPAGKREGQRGDAARGSACSVQLVLGDHRRRWAGLRGRVQDGRGRAPCLRGRLCFSRRDELPPGNLPLAATWTDLEGVVLSEVIQTERDKHRVMSRMCGIQKHSTLLDRRAADSQRQTNLAAASGAGAGEALSSTGNGAGALQ